MVGIGALEVGDGIRAATGIATGALKIGVRIAALKKIGIGIGLRVCAVIGAVEVVVWKCKTGKVGWWAGIRSREEAASVGESVIGAVLATTGTIKAATGAFETVGWNGAVTSAGTCNDSAGDMMIEPS